MKPKPSTASDYNPHQLDLVHSVCLYISTIIGDYIDDLVIVGGLVPNLIIPQAPLPEGVEAHVGTQDLDIGFSLGVFNSDKKLLSDYEEPNLFQMLMKNKIPHFKDGNLKSQ